MERLTDLFSGVLSMGWTALPVMAVVMAVRLLLRRAPRKYVYLLWAVVAFRLVCPVTVSTPLGLVAPETARQQAEAVQEAIREPVWAANRDWQPEPPPPGEPRPGFAGFAASRLAAGPAACGRASGAGGGLAGRDGRDSGLCAPELPAAEADGPHGGPAGGKRVGM